MIFSLISNSQNEINHLKINGITKDSIDINYYYHMNSDYDFLIGAYNNSTGSVPPVSELFLNGYICEIIIYDKPLNNIETYLVENYLRYRYFPQYYQTPVQILGTTSHQYQICDSLYTNRDFITYHWATGDTTRTIHVNRTGYYSVTVTDMFGYESSDTVFVQFPALNYSIGDTTICFGDTITWTITQDSSYGFLWQDSSTGNSLNIFSGGDYYCIITDSFGCHISSDTITVSIDSFPLASLFSSADTTLCSGVNLYPTNQEATSFLWYNGDSAAYTTVSDSGYYSLTAWNNRGCRATDSIRIQINGIAPVIDFSYDGHCLGDTTFFYNSSTTLDSSTFIQFIWSSGTLFSDTATNTLFRFPDTGQFTVTLQGYTSAGCYNKLSKNITIFPTPAIEWSQEHICQHQTTTIDPEIISQYPITSHLWMVDDTTTYSSFPLAITFDQPGNHHIIFTVTDSNNCSSSSETSFYVYETPEAGFYYDGFCNGTPVMFYDTSNTSSFNPIISYNWNFGDSSSSTIRNPQHIYFSPGNYFVTFMVKGVNGCADTTRQNITIYPTPQISFIEDTFCQNAVYTLLFDTLNNVNIESAEWIVDSSFYSGELTPQISFNTPGFHSVELIAFSENGCSDTVSSLIEVHNQPDASFEILGGNYVYYTEPLQLEAYDTSYSSYYWFLNEHQIPCSTYECTYHNEPDYQQNTVTLIVEDSLGCTDTSTNTFEYIPPPAGQYGIIKILDIDYTVENGFIVSSVQLYNKAHYPAYYYNLVYEVMGSGKIIINPQLRIAPYDTAIYTLPPVQKLTNDIFLCVSVSYPYTCFADTTFDKTCKNTGINSIKLLNFYPMPVANTLNLTLLSPCSTGITISVTSIDGKQEIIKEVNLQTGINEFQLDVSSLPKGAYIFKINSSYQMIMKKLIKQ
jgi:PKD repeat protein